MLDDTIKYFAGPMMRLARRCLVLLSVAGALSFNAYSGSFVAHIDADLDRDGKTESIDLDSGRDAALEVLRGGEVLWQGVPAAWKPWKLAIADVDGDGRLEIVVGVFKSTKFFPKPHNCLFIYGWSGDRGYPRWLGSSLGRPFTDFLFMDTGDNAGEHLAALETTLEGNMSLAFYRWNSFGFTLDRRQGDWRTARNLESKNGMIALEADGMNVLLDGEQKRSKL